MFWSSRVTCGVCSVPVPKSQASRTRQRGLGAVCRTCFERWSRSGSICVKCHAPVNGLQEPGVFTNLHALGHADCGGALLVV